ncbi:MAG TPA: tetratricopeptide repeat protein [Bryobacteraceae bacterium]|jgi:tetratricopeptide (TPR) repeat protein|nr:tetratricopeptide repeat protein [Bryobacteraceae bacterium]
MQSYLPRLAVACVFLSIVALPGALCAGGDTEQLIEGAHWKRAKIAVEARLTANPDDASAYYDLSRVALAFDEMEDAARAAEKAVELNKGNADYHAQLATVYATAAEHATVLKQVVLVHKMRREMEAAFAIDPKNIDAMLVQAVFEWQAPAVIGGSRQKSLAVMERLKSISPLWGNLMEARLFQNEDEVRTEKALQAAADVNPAFYRARILLADFYAAGDNPAKWAEAERIAKDALREHPDRAAAYSTLAKLYAAQGRYSELDTLLGEVGKMVPDDLSPSYFAAKVLLDHKRSPERAEAYLRKYLSQAPEALEPKLPASKTLLAIAAERVSTQSVSLRSSGSAAGGSQ